MKAAAATCLAALLLAGTAASGEVLDAAKVIARHLEARGGAERWQALDSLELTGTYAAFSFYKPFRLIRQRGDRYRLDYIVLDSPAVRARDGVGPWGLDPLLWPEATRLDEDPYKSQLERESFFGPLLLEPERRGITVELIGEGEVEGRATVDLRLTFPGQQEEIWHLDPESWLEVAVDAQIIDATQGPAPMRRRTFFDDFREVDGLVLPFQVDHEFGARLEAMTVEQVRLDPDLGDHEFAPPAVAPSAAEPDADPSAAGGDGDAEP
jgi:hypothetical protein